MSIKSPDLPKILTIDIETAPSLAYVWKLWDENIGLDQLVEATEILCFAAKWYNKKEIIYYSTHTHGKEAMLKAAWELIDEADIVVHFNGRAFDMPHLRREFLLAELGPPSPVRQVDLLQIAKTNFKFVSNKLDHISSQLGVGSKVKHTGFQLWLSCINGDDAAWKLMEKYNKQDVRITEKVYDKLKKWMTSGHPHVGLYTGIEHCCPVCGSESLQKRGTRGTKTNVSSYQRFSCNDCGAWSRSSRATGKTTTRLIGLG